MLCAVGFKETTEPMINGKYFKIKISNCIQRRVLLLCLHQGTSAG